eukprot:TRINITY_DN12317_c0_g1_i1.p1 TRINITY_DN12317_c0_g1~~TRINITY_DN12317_c0_g1_i1.p1  ORF type:complete len:583 (+),score=172.82 TRINITY_DN12317_c0_g1_i1:84-1832(+)
MPKVSAPKLLPAVLLLLALSLYVFLHGAYARAAGRAGAHLLKEVRDKEDALARSLWSKPAAQWAKHPGTSLGESLGVEGRWEACASAASCLCRSGVARAALPSGRVVLAVIDSEFACDAESFGVHSDSAAGEASCECEVGSRASSLAEAQQLCEAFGHDCKGVTCTVDGCTPRRGAPYLAGRAGDTSYVLQTTDTAAHVGGGAQGTHRVDGEPTIFVSIAAFRDADCHNTIDHLYATAKFPRRVFAGVVCQRREGEPEEACVGDYAPCQQAAEGEFCLTDQIRQRTFDAAESKGPTHARAIAASMYRGEDFFFMMDAHSRFVTHWDVKIVEEHAKCTMTSPKCVLSAYPMGVELADPAHPRPLGTPAGTPLDGFDQVPHLCNSVFHKHAVLKNKEALTSPGTYWPRPQPYTGAGLLFGPGKMLVEAPFDPYIPFVWDGEEFLYSARLWTWGYDLYSPGQNILYHHYGRKGAPRHTKEKGHDSEKGKAEKKVSYKRLQFIVDAPVPESDAKMAPRDDPDYPLFTRFLPKFGLGPHRSIAQYWDYARVDVRNRLGDPTRAYDGYFCRKYNAPRRQEDGPYPVSV